jgi:hypothetical protein
LTFYHKSAKNAIFFSAKGTTEKAYGVAVSQKRRKMQAVSQGFDYSGLAESFNSEENKFQANLIYSCRLPLFIIWMLPESVWALRR